MNLTLTPPLFSAWAKCRADMAVLAAGGNPKPPSIRASCQEGVPMVCKYWHAWKILVLWPAELLEAVTSANACQQSQQVVRRGPGEVTRGQPSALLERVLVSVRAVRWIPAVHTGLASVQPYLCTYAVKQAHPFSAESHCIPGQCSLSAQLLYSSFLQHRSSCTCCWSG